MDRKRSRLESQLCQAVQNADPRSVQLLLSQGASPDLVGSKGVAAIHLAVGKETEKNTRCLKLLLQCGADPNIRSSEGLTPVHIAALWGCYQNLKLLLMNGGNPRSKDNDGNTPGQLAEQQENQKCAQLLQEHQGSSVDTEDDDLPQFLYSLYSDHTDTSSYPDSDCSFISNSSVIRDFGEAPLSSTRRSSFFSMSNLNGRPSHRGMLHNRLSDMESKMHHWNNSTSRWVSEGPSLLSSTRISAAGSAAPVRIDGHRFCTKNDLFMPKSNELASTSDGKNSPSRRDTLPVFPSKQGCRKSVSFRDVDEYFPVFSPESEKEHPAVDGSHLPFNLSEYSDFLDSERIATVLATQGIDVTSPDHVYVFCRESSESTEGDMEKTVMSHYTLEESDDQKKSEHVKDVIVTPKESSPLPVGSSSSGTGSSHYSSCDSDHYTSALDASVHPKHFLLPAVNEDSVEPKSDKNVKTSSDFEPEQDGTQCSLVQPEPQVDSKPVSKEHQTGMLGDLASSEVKHPTCDDLVDNSSKHGIDQPVNELQDSFDLTFTPSPFVTGRTRSRLSRCSMRTGRTPESLHFTSSLFEETLPAPVRTRRQTPRSQSTEDVYSSPRVPCYTATHSGGGTGGNFLPADWQDTPSRTLSPGSSVSSSLPDTLILSKSVSESAVDSQTLSNTVFVENLDSSANAYERNLAEVILAIQGQALTEDFLTDDLTSTDEATSMKTLKDEGNVLKEGDWISEDCSSQPDPVSTSSSSSFSPRGSTEDSDIPSTPGNGCTPRYSMSRLSSCRRPQHLANLSYTPGGRPHILDLYEPVEYLYTDMEQGHKLIETHIPPTANTSLSSSMSSNSSEETILYDWKSMQTDMMKCRGKENQTPPAVLKKDKNEKGLIPKVLGLTDKELRLRLVELGESPGPISSRTRPTYMRRLRCLMQESNCKSPRQQKHSDRSQTDLGYSPELCLAMRTFKLPDCQADEQALCQQFDQPDQNRKWREGNIKSSFNYLLLDPRVTKNLPFRSHSMTTQECFQTFINSVFYVGKGKRSRPYSHLYEALEYYRGDKTSKKLCPKVQHILDVWNAEQGVISLHCFQNVIPVEAYTREACIVEAIGLKMLTNQKRGDFYGVVSNWPLKKKRELGVHLLYRAMQIFLAEGERQLRPLDIRQ